MHPRSLSAAILLFLADGTKPLAALMRHLIGSTRSISNRMSELRAAGLIQDTVTLTDEGRAAVEKLNESLSKRHARVRNHESTRDGD